jgi:predicted ATPase/DNA-binding SARP family transcriptional activator
MGAGAQVYGFGCCDGTARSGRVGGPGIAETTGLPAKPLSVSTATREDVAMGVTAVGAEIRISLLGGFSVAVAGKPIDDHWRLRKAKTLVKLLALAPGHWLTRDFVVDTLWANAEPQAASNNLHQILHSIRRMMGAESIALDDDVVRLRPAGGLTVDVDLFERAAAIGRASNDIAALREALALWTGPLLPEDQYADWALGHRERLAETHDAVTTLLGSRLSEQGELEAGLALLEALAFTRTLDEPLHRALIDTLAGLGRRWEAIEAYERLRTGLDEAYAVEPEPETKALYRRLLSAGQAMPATIPHNLPESTTSFIGRRRLLTELSAGLGRTRLLTLTGVGGVGKSRLALELARRSGASTEVPDGVWLVELAGIQDPEIVASTVASSLRLTLPGGPNPMVALAGQLASRQLLLIMDNCEHLLEACCDLVHEVLTRCPEINVVTTSREPLAIPGELVYRVPSLDLPQHGADLDLRELFRLEAVQLFMERAWLTVPSFKLNTKTAGPVAEICRRLDGIPLALELAAARLAHFTVDDLADRVGDALTLLGQRLRGRLDRQQTLAATLDWSHGLLEVDEQTTFRRLAVFAGGFDLDAAAAVCDQPGGMIISLISRLVDKSLVQAETAGPKTRYRLLEVVRQYAEARLSEAGELETCRKRHLEWYAAVASAHDPDRGDAVVGEPSEWFDAEHDNLRAALATGLGTDPTLALQLTTSTWRFWINRGLIAEGTRWLTLALNACPNRSALRARALAAKAVMHIRQAKSAELTAIGDEIVALLNDYGEPMERAHGYHQRALLTFMAGDWRLAQAQSDDALRIAAEFPAVTASAQHFAGVLALGRDEIESARSRFDAALEALTRVPINAPPFFIAMALGWAVDQRRDPPLPFLEETVLFGRRVGAQQAAGHVRLAKALAERMAGNLGAAFALIDGAQALFRHVDDRYGEAYALSQRGHALRWIGQYEEASRSLRQSESLRRELRDRRALALALAGRALNAASAGAAEQARSLGRKSVALMEESGDIAGTSATEVNLADAEVLLADLPAALNWLNRALAFYPVPGGHRALGWLHLLRGHVLRQLGDIESSTRSVAAAQEVFTQLGEQYGLIVAQKICNEGLPSQPA